MSAVKAGSAYVELTTRNAALMKGLADARKRLQDFGSATRAIGMKLFGVGAAATAPLSDRQLRAMEQTAANTRKLIKVVEDAGLTYG